MKRKSLTRQIQEELESKLKIGESKFLAKKAGKAQEGVYSFKTLKVYMEQANYFVKYCKKEHGCRYLDECRQYADEYLQNRIDRGNSPYTLHLIRSALCKLYGDTSRDYIPLPKRRRQDITRSRGEAVRDKHFSEKNHKDIVDFCKGSGLRRHELEKLRGTDFFTKRNGSLYLTIRGKGGKYREVPILEEYRGHVLKLMRSAEDGFVFEDVPGGMDVHSYRAIYATAFYKRIARPAFRIPSHERYYCRGDRKGVILDKKAMLEVSRALGHNRVSVIAGHYLIGVR